MFCSNIARFGANARKNRDELPDAHPEFPFRRYGCPGIPFFLKNDL
jgi:hypothetical protein